MKDKEKLQKLKENYDNIEIPSELDDIVNNALYSNKYNNKVSLVKSLSLVASLVAVFVCSVNTSPLVANALDRIPVIGKTERHLSKIGAFIWASVYLCAMHKCH